MSEELRAYRTTRVAVEKTRMQIDKMLRDRGAIGVRISTMCTPEREQLTVEFVWGEQRRAVRMTLGYDPDNQQVARSAHRALYWMLLRRFDGVDYGIEEFEIAFMPYLVTDSGLTVAENAKRFGADVPGGFSFSDQPLLPASV